MNQNKLPEFNSNEELPLMLNAQDVGGYLKISFCCAYQVMKSKGFPVIRIGKRLLVTRDHFLEWVENAHGDVLS